MADLCSVCSRPADLALLTPPALQFLCNWHYLRGTFIERSNAPLFAAAVELSQQSHLSEQFWEAFASLPAEIVTELASAWQVSEDHSRFRALARPEDIMLLKDRDRLLRLLRKAGVCFPNAFISEIRAERLLVQMLKSRMSLGVIKQAFVKWPAGPDKFKVLGHVVKNRYGPFEKKLLVELLLPHYLGLTVGRDTPRAISVIARLEDEKLKKMVLSYIRYIQNMSVLKAVEVNRVTMQLPRSVRRYIVEVFIAF